MAEGFIPWLQEQHDAIMSCEAEALRLLKAGDKQGYEAAMREKALKLAALAEGAQQQLTGLPEGVRRLVEKTLGGYSANAAMALQLNSVFFMSALLYKDEHGKDEPDNLQQFIAALSKEGL